MFDFSTFPNTNGSFPAVLAKNATSPTTTDGTPMLADATYNDEWGFFQAILTAAGVSPSDVAEAYNNSQLLNALINIICPVSAVLPIMANDDPANLGMKLIVMDYQLIEVADYGPLVAACYCGDSQNPTAGAFYRADSGGIRDTNGTHMRLPRGDGAFLRANNGTFDLDAGRLMGESSNSVMHDHKHEVDLPDSTPTPNRTMLIDASALSAGSDRIMTSYNSGSNVVVEANTILNGGTTNANENAPLNLACKLAIRY